MGSQSSLTKGVPKTLLPEIDQLLVNGAFLTPVSDELQEASKHLSAIDVANIELVRFVQCAHSNDWDWTSVKVKNCTGRIELNPNLKEIDGELQCAECGRTFRLRSKQSEKMQFDALRVTISQEGVIAKIDQILRKGKGLRVTSREPGIWAIIGDARYPDGAWIVLVDFLPRHHQKMTQEFAAQHSIRFLVINSANKGRFLRTPWIQPVGLSDLITEKETIKTLLDGMSASGEMRPLAHVSLPVYTTGTRPTSLIRDTETPKKSRFAVEFCGDALIINSISVLAPQAKSALSIFNHLWNQFQKDIGNGCLAKDYKASSIQELGKHILSNADDAKDDSVVRRSINRLQETITKSLRTEGFNVDREDIIECLQNGNEEDAEDSDNASTSGYRINPFRVAFVPPSK